MTQLAQEKTEDRGPGTEDRRPVSEVSDLIGQSSVVGHQSSVMGRPALSVALLTGGDDRPYVLGLVPALTSEGITLDVIGSNDLELPELLNNSSVNFLNLRGDQRSDANLPSKVARVLRYYWRLVSYAAMARVKVFHILWNNKFEFFDRTLLTLCYKLTGKRIVLTAHNVNMRRRDGMDSWLNRWSLRTHYRLADHIFVHTDKMKAELLADFAVQENKVSVVPFGINNATPKTDLTNCDARRMLGIADTDKTILCFGQIAPYKGLEYLVAAFAKVLTEDGDFRLIIAGKPKWNDEYWKSIEQLMIDNSVRHRVIERIEHVPDEQTELYFKAADVLVLSYTQIFQSGVIFLGYSFGLPAIVADVGSLKEEVMEGETGFVCKPRDSSDLARVIRKYFDSDLFRNLEARRADIKKYANEKYSWSKVAAITTTIYSRLLTSDV
jgi:glycosyltransferase involved in cell wall biosynthesis